MTMKEFMNAVVKANISAELTAYATAEIKKNGSVNQFYGDESARDIKVMRPGPKVQECLNYWLEKYKDDVINALKGAA